jgi:hypothetical protein
MARSAKGSGTAPERTAHDWAIESMLHSSFCADPRGEPGRQPPRFVDIPVCPDHVGSRAAERREVGEDDVKEEAQPGALAPARRPDAVHAVVPIAAADQRKTVGSGREALVDRANTVLEERPVHLSHTRLAVRLLGVGRQDRRLEEWRALVEHLDVAGRPDVVRHHERQPQQIVRAA